MSSYMSTIGAATRALNTKPKPKPQPPPEIGSPAWLQTANSADVARWMTLISPDYSQVVMPDPAAAGKQADDAANAWAADQTNAVNSIRDQLKADYQLSSDAATNFNKAFANILTGGLEGQAGRDYAFKTFGGHYLGEIQTNQGIQMLTEITRDFTAKDHELLDKLADIADKKPEIRQQLYDDVWNKQVENAKFGIDAAQDDFSSRMKAAALLVSTLKQQEKLRASAEDNRLDNMTKVIVAKLKQKGVPTQVVKDAQTGQVLVINKQTGQVVGRVGGPKPVKQPKQPDPIVRRWNDGSMRQSLDGGRTWTVLTPAHKPTAASPSGSKVKFDSVRSDTLRAARDLWNSDQRPTRQAAYQALMEGFGKRLLGAGYKPKTVQTMINRILNSVAAGRQWGGGAASGGTSFTEP